MIRNENVWIKKWRTRRYHKYKRRVFYAAIGLVVLLYWLLTLNL